MHLTYILFVNALTITCLTRVFDQPSFILTNNDSAIIMWRNSIVFHSMDKMTSMFIHILPALVIFSLRWSDHISRKEYPLYEEMDGTIYTNVKDFWFTPFLYYMLWQTIYLVKTEVVSKKKLDHNSEIMTSLRWMTKKKDSASYKLLSVFGVKYQLPTFVLIQAAYVLATFLVRLIMPAMFVCFFVPLNGLTLVCALCVLSQVMPLFYHSFVLHALYLGTIFIIALVNGSSYYFHVFAKRYIEEIGKRVAETEQNVQKLNTKQES